MYGFIYLTTNKINGKKYIGMCKNTHRENYIGSGKLLKQAVKKYGKKSFKRDVLQECKTFDELSEAEIYWIKFYNAVEDSNFYNLTSGGFGGNSEYLKDYWSHLNKEEKKVCRNWSKRSMVGFNNPMYGKKHSIETKKMIGLKSVNRNWNKNTPWMIGENNHMSKRVLVEMNKIKKEYSSLSFFSKMVPNIPYSTLKSIAQKNRFSKKYNLKITYV